jgi:hypothetical protein
MQVDVEKPFSAGQHLFMIKALKLGRGHSSTQNMFQTNFQHHTKWGKN